MAGPGDAGLESTGDDELVEIQVNRAVTRTRAVPHGHASTMFLRRRRDIPDITPASPTRSRSARAEDYRVSPAMPQLQRASEVSQTPQPAPVIDLTEEPDSPAEQRPSQPPSHIGLNPRRTNSQRTTPPSLLRSDSTFMGPGASVIDLTMDSPEDERTSEPRVTRSHRHHHHYHHHHHHHRHRPPSFGHDQLIELEFLNPTDANSLNSFLARGVRRMAGFLENSFMTRGFPGTRIEYPPPAVFTDREPSPKPPMEPVPPTRDGFIRDTSSTEERVVICPACNDELAYDPTGSKSQQSSNTTSMKKRKRTAGEHHFWALKKCGHVYCTDCFENRKPTKAFPEGVGFRASPGKTLSGAPNDIRCAVENCDTKVAPKTEWVGIYL